MSSSILTEATALSDGADLWIITQGDISKWSQKMNWYLNFQIGKTQRHSTPKISEFLELVLKETDLKQVQLRTQEEKSNSAVLFVASQLLPCKSVLLLPYLGDLFKWIGEIAKYQKDLFLKLQSRPNQTIEMSRASAGGKRSGGQTAKATQVNETGELRVFLPESVDPRTFLGVWNELNFSYGIEVVAD